MTVNEWANKFKLDKNIDMPSLAKQRDKNVYKNLRKPTVMVFANKSTADKFISKRIKKRYRTSRMPYMKEIMDCLSVSSPIEQVKLMKGTQLGAALSLDTPLASATGWITMGDVKAGDKLYDETGKSCKVVSVLKMIR